MEQLAVPLWGTLVEHKLELPVYLITAKVMMAPSEAVAGVELRLLLAAVVAQLTITTIVVLAVLLVAVAVEADLPVHKPMEVEAVEVEPMVEAVEVEQAEDKPQPVVEQVEAEVQQQLPVEVEAEDQVLVVIVARVVPPEVAEQQGMEPLMEQEELLDLVQ
jgi:hypothetical protein